MSAGKLSQGEPAGGIGQGEGLLACPIPSQVPKGFLGKKWLLCWQEQWVSAALCSCLSAGCTGCVPEHLDGTLAHLSAPEDWVLPWQLNSAGEGSLENKVRREILEVVGGYRCDVRRILLLLSSKAPLRRKSGPDRTEPFDTSQSIPGCRSAWG